MPRSLPSRATIIGVIGSTALLQGLALAQAASVTPADVAGKYFVATNGFETRVIHPMWIGDTLVVEDIRFTGNYPLISANLPVGAVGVGANHPAAMVSGILTYAAPALFGGRYPQTVVFKRTNGPATGGIHAVITFEGPPEGSPSTVEALTRSTTEWQAGQDSTKGNPGNFPG
jgi:hypothetical protein